MYCLFCLNEFIVNPTNGAFGSQIRFYAPGICDVPGQPCGIRHMIIDAEALDFYPGVETQKNNALKLMRVVGGRFHVGGGVNDPSAIGASLVNDNGGLTGTYSAGTFGGFATADKWISMGTPRSSTTIFNRIYGFRTQWDGQALTFNLQDRDGNLATTGDKDAEIQWGNQSGSALNFNFLNSATNPAAVTRIMRLNQSGLVDIGSSGNVFGEDFFGFFGSAGNLRLRVEGDILADGNIFRFSDERFKKNIADIENPLGILRRMRGAQYEYNTEANKGYGFTKGKTYGFIAQELQKVFPEAVKEMPNKRLAVDYEMVIPLLVEALKAEHNEKDELAKKLIALETRLEKIEAALGTGKPTQASTEMAVQKEQIVGGDVLGQNFPNPFTGSTQIRYNISEAAGRAQILVRNSAGKEVKLIELQRKGIGLVNINFSNMPAGIYTYSILADGKILETRQMTFLNK